MTSEKKSPYSERTVDTVESATVIDMMSVLSLNPVREIWNQKLPKAIADDFRRSRISAFHNSPGYRSPNAYTDMLAWFARWNAVVARNSDLFVLISNASDIVQARREGRVGVIQGLQNSDHFRTADDVELFYSIGQRCSQLTYNWQNLIGSGCTERVDGGVSDFGVEIIGRMNKVGMLVDVSHCGDRTTLDAVEISSEPIAITHANCRALCDHPRNKSDETIKRLADKGGVIGIAGVRMFVTKSDPTTISNIVDHIDHVVNLVGVEHVGIGSDADLYGYDSLPSQEIARLKAANKDAYAIREKTDVDGFSHPRKMFDLTDELISRGYKESEIVAILGGNFLRLLSSVWK